MKASYVEFAKSLYGYFQVEVALSPQQFLLLPPRLKMGHSVTLYPVVTAHVGAIEGKNKASHLKTLQKLNSDNFSAIQKYISLIIGPCETPLDEVTSMLLHDLHTYMKGGDTSSSSSSSTSSSSGTAESIATTVATFSQLITLLGGARISSCRTGREESCVSTTLTSSLSVYTHHQATEDARRNLAEVVRRCGVRKLFVMKPNSGKSTNPALDTFLSI